MATDDRSGQDRRTESESGATFVEEEFYELEVVDGIVVQVDPGAVVVSDAPRTVPDGRRTPADLIRAAAPALKVVAVAGTVLMAGGATVALARRLSAAEELDALPS